MFRFILALLHRKTNMSNAIHLKKHASAKSATYFDFFLAHSRQQTTYLQKMLVGIAFKMIVKFAKSDEQISSGSQKSYLQIFLVDTYLSIKTINWYINLFAVLDFFLHFNWY